MTPDPLHNLLHQLRGCIVITDAIGYTAATIGVLGLAWGIWGN